MLIIFALMLVSWMIVLMDRSVQSAITPAYRTQAVMTLARRRSKVEQTARYIVRWLAANSDLIAKLQPHGPAIACEQYICHGHAVTYPCLIACTRPGEYSIQVLCDRRAGQVVAHMYLSCVPPQPGEEIGILGYRVHIDLL